ncbi:CHAT domain-containing protein, partial [Roseateles sp. GG27B]
MAENYFTASDVLAKLYAKPWRLLHISAHGVFDLMHVDGRCRSGVLLSDGLLITAAEIAAMETVPELVFLNCCHL